MQISVSYIAALKAGLVIIPSSELLRAKDIDYRLIHSEAKAILVKKEFVEEFEHVQNLANVTSFIVGEEKSNWHSLMKLAEQQSPNYKKMSEIQYQIYKKMSELLQ